MAILRYFLVGYHYDYAGREHEIKGFINKDELDNYLEGLPHLDNYEVYTVKDRHKVKRVKAFLVKDNG